MLSKDVILFTLIAIVASVVGWQISMLLTNGLIIVFAILFVLFMGSSIDPLVWNWLDELLMLFNGGLAGLVSGGLSALFLRQCWRLSRAWISVWWLAWVLGGIAVWLLMWWQVGSDILPDEFLLSALWLMTGLCIAASFTLIVPPWRNR